MAVTFAKLRNGDWGLRADTPIEEGQSVTVALKDGGSKKAVVGKILWSGDSAGKTITLATVQKDSVSGSGGGGSGGSGGSGGRNVCGACGRPGRLVQDLEDGMMKHHSCCDIPP